LKRFLTVVFRCVEQDAFRLLLLLLLLLLTEHYTNLR
jgi:hypothetical protein